VKFNTLVEKILLEADTKNDTDKVSKVIIVKNNKILLLQKKNGKYELPGGHIETGESAINGAKREVKEETGLDVTNLKKIASNNIRFLFKGKINTNNVTISDEHKGYKFILQKDIFKLPLSKWSKNDLKFLKQKEKQQIEENYADGKKKGKSKPGRVKKSGASCKGSVTELRRKAKKYGGEKGKMYHWCANMKGGKKK
tara:strand:- start:19 stop:612 length:594 start_codon:yes stop_codon:yes gene_type:complete